MGLAEGHSPLVLGGHACSSHLELDQDDLGHRHPPNLESKPIQAGRRPNLFSKTKLKDGVASWWTIRLVVSVENIQAFYGRPRQSFLVRNQ